jgi:hypothetical protein
MQLVAFGLGLAWRFGHLSYLCLELCYIFSAWFAFSATSLQLFAL